jgi:putative hemolysin
MEILIISILLLLNGVFAMYEIALVSSRKSRLEEQAKYGNKGAKTALLLLQEPEKILSAIQVGITLIGIVSGAFGGLALAEDVVPLFSGISWLEAYAEGLAIFTVVGLITYLALVIGELVPKTIALNNPERIAIFLSPAMKVLGSILFPIVWFLSVSTKLVLTLFRIRKNTGSTVTEEELRLLLKQGSENGVIEKEESDIINEVIRFGDKRAGSIMTHRVDADWIDSTAPVDEILIKAMHASYSRMPVCLKSPDEILGIVAIKDLLSYYIKHQTLILSEIFTEPLYLPEQMPAIKVLEIFRKTKNHFGIVINEYGSMEGIITLHDVTENIMGELPAIEDPDEPEVFQREDGSYLIDGSMTLEDVKDLLQLYSLSNKDEDVSNINTIGGLAMYKLNRVPRIGDKFHVKGHLFEIIDMDGHRVDKIMVDSNNFYS